MKYIDPTGRKANPDKRSSHPTISTLAGKVVGVLSNDWPSYEAMIVRMREQLLEKHHVTGVLCYRIPRMVSASDELFDKVAAECDAAIVGLAN